MYKTFYNLYKIIKIKIINFYFLRKPLLLCRNGGTWFLLVLDADLLVLDADLLVLDADLLVLDADLLVLDADLLVLDADLLVLDGDLLESNAKSIDVDIGLLSFV